LAPGRFSSLLALEIPKSKWPAEDIERDQSACSTDER
jgi:hypothetical protein